MVIAFNMWATLRGVGRARFSKTAWACPGHGKTRRHAAGDGAPAVGRRRFAHDLAEGAAERAQTGEADVETDLRYAAIGLAQQEHRPLHASALQVAMGCLAEGGAEGANEVRLRDQRDPREGRNIERLSVRAIHGVARTKQASIGLFNLATHAQ